MKKMIILFTALCVPTLCFAQSNTPFGKVDTVTAGECDDTDPALSHSPGFSGGQTWLVFARNTGTTSEIIGKKFNSSGTGVMWDSTLVSISVKNTPLSQRKPDIAELSSSYYYRGTFHLAVWECKQDTVWNIYYSRLIDNDSAWSTREPLTHDTVDNTDVQVRPLQDSTFIIFWKRKSVLLYSLLNPLTFTAPETVAVSTSDSLEFDISASYGDGNLVWTSRDTSGKNIMIYQRLSTYPTLSFSTPETLSFEQSAFNPRLVGFYSNAVLFETVLNSDREVYSWGGYYQNISNDPLADDRNPRVFVNPVITKRGATKSSAFFPYYSVLVMEKFPAANPDSLLLFFSGGDSDTLKSAGYNRNACIGSNMYFYNSSGHVLVAWESNRSGHSHIYSRMVISPIDEVKEEPSHLASFNLDQNFPNPFNPATHLRFEIPVSEFVTLKVFDVLGREVATLVNERKSPGTYEVEWNASVTPSGVYFYRLSAGSFTVTKKMSLLK